MFYCNTFYRTRDLFCWTWLLGKKIHVVTSWFLPALIILISITLFNGVEYMLPMFLRQPYSINCFLPQPQYNVCFLPYFPFPPQFSLCSVSSPFHVVCFYAYINSFSLFLILWCICFCFLYLLGCICTVLKVNLFYLSRKLFLTAIPPDGFLSFSLSFSRNSFSRNLMNSPLQSYKLNVFNHLFFIHLLFSIMFFILLDIWLIHSYIIYSDTLYFPTLLWLLFF